MFDILVPALIALIGLILHSIEFIKSIRKLYKLFTNKVTNLFPAFFASYNMVLSGTGVGLSITLLVGTFTAAPVAALALTLAPILIPTLMLFIYINKLIKSCITLHNKLQENATHAASLSNEKNETENKSPPVSDLELHKSKRKIAFQTLECVAASLVVVGSVTGLFPVIIAGVALGFIGKIIEKVDEKYDYKFSLAVSRFFSKLTQEKQPPSPKENKQDFIPSLVQSCSTMVMKNSFMNSSKQALSRTSRAIPIPHIPPAPRNILPGQMMSAPALLQTAPILALTSTPIQSEYLSPSFRGKK